MLDQANLKTREGVLSVLPPPVLTMFREQWEPKFASLQLWHAASEPAHEAPAQ